MSRIDAGCDAVEFHRDDDGSVRVVGGWPKRIAITHELLDQFSNGLDGYAATNAGRGRVDFTVENGHATYVVEERGLDADRFVRAAYALHETLDRPAAGR